MITLEKTHPTMWKITGDLESLKALKNYWLLSNYTPAGWTRHGPTANWDFFLERGFLYVYHTSDLEMRIKEFNEMFI